MIRIGITGATGFIGEHARSYLSRLEKTGKAAISVIPRTAFSDATALAELVSSCDAIMHFAGTKWGDDAEMYKTNIALAQKLIDACRAAAAQPHILFASSIHAEGPTTFGKSKKEAGRILLAWAAESGARVTVFPLPHVFGEFARPFHNSAVATLCHQLARGEPSEVKSDATVKLLYVREAVARFYEALCTGEVGEVSLPATEMKLPDLYALLNNFANGYAQGTLPQLSTQVEVALFITLHYHILLNRAD